MDTVSLIAYAGSVLRITLLVVIGLPLLNWSRKKLSHVCSQRFSQHSCILVGRIIFYCGLIFIVVTILHELGFNVGALLGVAGVFGVAIGFASQTSISNIISGFFLVLERPFSIGDIIKSGDTIGVVESIDLLSLNIRTRDNKLVRLPNEAVLKNSLTNLTYYPIKRMDFELSVPYAEDVESIKTIIYDVIKSNELCLQEPVPVVMMQKIGQHDYDTETRVFFIIRAWVIKEKFTSAPAILMQQLKHQFDKNKAVITVVHTNV
jgi:small-conductance mechanosensitive channel